jgi:hypothetical protein
MMIPNLKFRTLFCAALAMSMGFALAPSLHAASPKTTAAPKKKAAPEPAKPVGEVVQYEALEQNVGKDIVIETTLKTTRRGTLMKYTQPALTLKLTPEAGGFELTVPRETIKTITVLPQPAVLDKDAGTSGAKKN